MFALSRLVDQKSKAVANRLGDPENLKSVDEMIRQIGGEIGTRLKTHVAEAKRIAGNMIRPLLERRDAMKVAHRVERTRHDAGQKMRLAEEQKARAARVRTGAKGVWDILMGRYSKIRKQNEMEAFFALQRDRAQRHDLIQVQLGERRQLQAEIALSRERSAKQVLALYQASAKYRRMNETGRAPGLDFGR